MTIALSGPTKLTETVSLTPGSPGCSSGVSGTTCAVKIAVHACSSKTNCYTGSIATYDAVSCTKSACSIPSGAKALSENQSVAFSVKPGKKNVISLTLDGIVASVEIVPSASSTLTVNPSGGFFASKCLIVPQSVTTVALDADGNTIVGPGAPASPTLISDDTTHMAVATPSPGASPNAFSLVPPSSLAAATIPKATSVVHLTAGYTTSGATVPVTSATNVTFNGDVCGVATSYPVPTATSMPEDMTVGPDGALWFVEYNKSRVGRITTDGSISDYSLPASSAPFGITTGPDGNLWIADFHLNEIYQVSPAGSLLHTYPPKTASSSPTGIVTGKDGQLWFTECNLDKIGSMTSGGTANETGSTPTSGSGPYKIAVGADGALWFTEYFGNNIGRVTTAGGTPAEYPVLTASSRPNFITAGPDGNLWFTECASGANNIGKITTDGHVSEFTVPTAGSAPEQITVGADGALWFAEYNGNQVGRITTDGHFSATKLANGSNPYGIVKGPDGNLWISEQTANAIVRLQ